MSQKTWGGRFAAPTDRLVEQFTESISFDRRLYPQDVRASQAHARMLAAAGILSAAEAEQILDAQPPNVAVVDLMISGGAGLDLCRTIRECASIPILAVSAVDSRDAALDAGVDAFLRKPLEPLRLVSTVRDLIGTSAYLRRGAPLS